MDKPKQTLWSSAAKTGLILGVLLIAVSAFNFLFTELAALALLINVIEFVAIISIVWFSARGYSMNFTKAEGFSYAQALGYIMAIMCFTGFIAGFGQYFMQVKIAPEYYNTMLDQALEITKMPVSKEEIAQAKELSQNILYLTFSWVVTMIMYGGFMGLILAVFLKRQPIIEKNEQ